MKIIKLIPSLFLASVVWMMDDAIITAVAAAEQDVAEMEAEVVVEESATQGEEELIEEDVVTSEEGETADDETVSDETGESEAAAEEEVATEAAAATDDGETTSDATEEAATQQQESEAAADAAADKKEKQLPVQAGPLVDLLGPSLLSLEMIDETTAQFKQHLTSDALAGKKVIGLYFSADWCGPCRQFTPELVNFYNRMNNRRGRKGEFEIVWISRCRDVDSYGQYFTQMNWLAMPPEEAMGQRGMALGDKYKVKGIPSLVLLDDLGQVITTDARNKIPQDTAGIGFPWRSPLATVISVILPRSLRLMLGNQLGIIKSKVIDKVKSLLPGRAKAPAMA
uniref:Thioredoxin domain-containing protein n=1 Tax=Craspedostauros australis TaxID=1486917 RepID=A0A7R9ZRT0_9STRA|mmetsp:Transcript_7569/g.20493  ORF Transcript_7569/g.20493 Transcript_7569/m.20493 type:complete len:340 (+) Transcript_7569:185-1204(+)